jgi:1-carboxybiuret hydrolase subunit AtzH-like protein
MNWVLRLALMASTLLCVMMASQQDGSFAQAQKSGGTAAANLAIDLPDVVAEVKAAHERYERALVSNDDAVLGASFRNDPRTVRYGNAENLYGYAEIEAYRANSSGPGPRRLARTVITTYGRDFAVASTLSYRANAPGKVGRQMQTWVRFPDGWKIVAAHVSTIDEPR